MDSILVFDDFKHCFRELDTSNYNDDLVVGCCHLYEAG